MERTKTPRYIKISEYRYPASFIPELVQSAINYKPKVGDIFVVTYPKCGTMWMIQIVMSIMRRGNIPTETHEYFASCPHLEMLGEEELENMPGPGPIKTHFPFKLTPYSADAKYIYVARHPKDCCISFYHHTKFLPLYYFADGSFDDFFELFIEGKTDFGDYFDHLLSWYDHRNDTNVFFITYEELKADIRGSVAKIIKFLGSEYESSFETDENLLEKVIYLSSLDYMKTHNNDNWQEMINRAEEFSYDPNLPRAIRAWAKLSSEALKDGQRSTGAFIRDGQTDHGKTFFTEEQEQRLQERIRIKTEGSDVMSLWKSM